MLSRLLSFFFTLIVVYAAVNAQTASIKADDEVFLNEVIGFEAIFMGTVSSYLWDFGDNTTSTQKNPSHTYSSFGTVTVNLTVNFAAGGTATATKTVQVHDLPVADFSMDNSNFCFFNQDVCIKDNSKMGATTSGYSSRLILWGDGQSESNTSPSIGDLTCYANYPNAGGTPYNIVVEVVNDKGCEAKWQKLINILPDYKPSFRYQLKGATCDDQEACFINDSSSQRADIQTVEWDFGDGTTGTGWTNVCHKYTTSGAYVIKLKVTLKNGCVGEYVRTIQIRIYDFEAKVLKPDSVICFPETFRLVAVASIAGASYTWELYDADTTLIKIAGFNIVENISVPCPGDYWLRLKVTIGFCTKFSRYVNLKSQGVSADFKILNRNQCTPRDTMYFLNQTKSHPDAIVTYAWEFNDSNAVNCIGWPLNCNYDTSQHSRHFYSDTGCYDPKLIATDISTGCVSEKEIPASIWTPSDAIFSNDIARPCIGNRQEYGVQFFDNICKNVLATGSSIEVCTDSSKNPQLWEGYNIGQRFFYRGVADKDGWVTVGFVVKMGSRKYYTSIDTNSVQIDDSRECVDTIWYHRWFKLNPEPKMDFSRFRDTFCLPITNTLSYVGTEVGRLTKMTYAWNVGDSLNVQYITGDSIIDISHTYTEEGRKNAFIVLEDSFGCYNTINFTDVMGYENSFSSDTIICLGQSVDFIDILRYYGDPYPYWRDASRPEKISWDFDDGNGFSTSGPIPSHTYTAKGRYNLRMATNDEDGCVDTAYASVLVGGVNAAIVDNSETYLCDQIIQFFDSSYFDFIPTSDFITDYYWNFGDNTRESLLENPYHYYNRNGEFLLTLVVKTDAGCLDTLEIPIYLTGPEPYFDIISDTIGCVPFTATFKSKSNNVSDFIWRFGDQDNSMSSAGSDSTISFTYTEPGTYFISLEGNDSFYNSATNNSYSCSAIFPDSANTNSRKIVVLPVPEVHFDFNEPVCVGQPVVFKNQSDTIYKELNWHINNFDTTTSGDLTYTFTKAGRYAIDFTPSYIPTPYQRACFDSFDNSITVSEVVAGFTFEVRGLCSEFIFTDTSKNTISYSWDFDHPTSYKRNTSILQNPSHTYGKDKGEYTVSQIVISAEGCKDTFLQNIEVEYITDLKVYNVFTPNSDGPNEVFQMDIENYDLYNLKIFNRYGELVFESEKPSYAWNGKQDNVGNNLPESTYFYVFRYRYNCDGKIREVEGLVDLIR